MSPVAATQKRKLEPKVRGNDRSLPRAGKVLLKCCEGTPHDIGDYYAFEAIAEESNVDSYVNLTIPGLGLKFYD